MRIMNPPAFSWTWGSASKTVITLTAIESLLHDMWAINRVLVIAPLRVAQSTWKQEAAKWPHLRNLSFALAVGSAKERRAALRANAEVTVINRENVQWLVSELGAKWPFDMVVIDELSSFRNPSAKRFKALRKVRPVIKRVVGLTGTPAPKGLIDLWAQIYLLDQGERLGRTVSSYRNRWFSAGRHDGYVVYEWLPRKGAEESIYGKLSDICLSMQAVDHIDMPACTRIVEKVGLPPKARKQYRRLERDYVLALNAETTVSAVSAGALAGKLQHLSI